MASSRVPFVAELCCGLRPYAEARTTLALLGASGAGKSTIVNALAGRELMPTGDVRHVDGKGRHTTTHRELMELPTVRSSSTPQACAG